MNRKYGIYCAGVLMESYDDSSEAYQAFKKAVEETDVFHELKIIQEVSHEAITDFSVQ